MKRVIFIFLIFSILSLSGSDLKNYEYSGSIENPATFGKPSRIHLTSDFIRKSSNYPADIRLFDGDGSVVPYVIYPNYIPAEMTKEIDLKTVAFDNKNGKSVIVVELPHGKKKLTGIVIKTGAVDFVRNVVVEVETEDGKYKKIAEDRVFDYSSKISLRKTMIRFPEMEIKKLRITIDDENSSSDSGFSIAYKGAIVKVNDNNKSSFKIGIIAGIVGRVSNRKVFSDSIDVTNMKVKINKEKSSYFYIDVPNIDINNIQIQIQDNFYFRKVEVCEPRINKKSGKEICRNIGSGSIYKMPGMSQGESRISLNTRSADRLKIVVINDDNPPLKINGVKISWIRQHLYFIPEQNKKYTIYTGGKNIKKPVYDIARIIARPSSDKDMFPEISLGSIVNNPAFTPSVDEEPGFLKKHGFTIVITSIFLILGVWLISLFKKY